MVAVRLFFLHFVEGHAAPNAGLHTTVALIAENALGTHEIVEHGLTLQDVGTEWDIFYCHNVVLLFLFVVKKCLDCYVHLLCALILTERVF